MEKRILSIKQRFAEEGKTLKKLIPNLEAVFCIGSCANNQNFSDSKYQDFDIHLYVDKSFLNKKDLDAIKAVFRKVAENFEDQNTAIDYCIKDKPWKMLPRKKINIGFHGTLLNRIDYMKRIGPNYILALNMFDNSETLSGQLVYPKRSIAQNDFLSQAGGIGWLKENFYRLLNVLDPDNEAMSVPIKEVAIYFGLSPLMHYYYLRNGMTATRSKSHAFFMSQKSVPKTVRDAVEFIYGFKNENKECCQQDNFPLLEATYIIIKYVEGLFTVPGAKVIRNQQSILEDEESDFISNWIGRQIGIRSSKNYFSMSTFAETLATIKTSASAFSNVSPDEYFESLNYLVKNSNANEINRAYFFEQGDLRASNGVDFSLESFESLIYSWEKGIATYVQRLNEIYLNSPKLTEEDLMLAKILVYLSFKKFSELKNKKAKLGDLDAMLGIPTGLSLDDRYFFCLKFLAELGDSVLARINRHR